MCHPDAKQQEADKPIQIHQAVHLHPPILSLAPTSQNTHFGTRTSRVSARSHGCAFSTYRFSTSPDCLLSTACSRPILPLHNSQALLELLPLSLHWKRNELEFPHYLYFHLIIKSESNRIRTRSFATYQMHLNHSPIDYRTRQ